MCDHSTWPMFLLFSPHKTSARYVAGMSLVLLQQEEKQASYSNAYMDV